MLANSFKNAAQAWFKTLGYSAWAVGAGFFVPGIILSIMLLPFITEDGTIRTEGLSKPVATVMLFAAQYAFGLALLCILPKFFERLSQSQFRERFGFTRRPRWSDLGLALGTFAVYMVATIAVLSLVKLFLPGLDLDQTQDVGFSNVSDVLGLVASFIALVIMAPVAEELIFRGYLFGSIRPLVGVIASVIVTSVIFGAVHGQLNVGIDVAVLSVFLCLLRVKTGSIWSSIFLHMTKNALAYFLLFVAPLIGLQIQ